MTKGHFLRDLLGLPGIMLVVCIVSRPHEKGGSLSSGLFLKVVKNNDKSKQTEQPQ